MRYTLLDSIYYAIVTVTTVGYGDITPLTQEGRFATTYYIISVLFWLPSKVGTPPSPHAIAHASLQHARQAQRPFQPRGVGETPERRTRRDHRVLQGTVAAADQRAEGGLRRLPPGHSLWGFLEFHKSQLFC